MDLERLSSIGMPLGSGIRCGRSFLSRPRVVAPGIWTTFLHQAVRKRLRYSAYWTSGELQCGIIARSISAAASAG